MAPAAPALAVSPLGLCDNSTGERHAGLVPASVSASVTVRVMAPPCPGPKVRAGDLGALREGEGGRRYLDLPPVVLRQKHLF